MTATFVDLAKGGEIRHPMSLRKKLSTRRCQVSMRSDRHILFDMH